MDRLWFDLRTALRSLLRSRRFTVVAVAIFALAIGANATIYTLADRLFFAAPAHVENPSELVQVARTEGDEVIFGSLAYPDFQHYREHGQAFASLMAFDERLDSVRFEAAGDGAGPTGSEGATRSARYISFNYFDTLGTSPSAGRWFTADEERVEDPARVALLGERRAEELFGDAEAGVGRAVRLNGHPFTVVGVVPAGFHGTNPLLATPDLWVPITTHALLNPQFGELALRRIPGNTWTWLNVVGRLAEGATLEGAQADVSRMAAHLEQEFPEWNEGWGATVSAGARHDPNRRSELVSITRLLALGVVAVLLIALLDLAILLGARAADRSRELRVRLALGAARGRLVRALAIESVVVGLLGALGGFALAQGATRAIAAVFPYTFDLGLRPDLGVLGFSALLGTATALVVGWLAARSTLRRLQLSSLARGDEATGGWRQGALVALQVALATLLVVGGALTTRSLREARGLDLGFETTGLHFVSVAPRNHGYEGEAAAQFARQSLEALAATPGFEQVSLTRMVPFRARWTSSMVPEGLEVAEGEEPSELFNAVAPGYFEALGTPLVAGRDFTWSDATGAPRVAIVNRAFAERYWRGDDAVGKTIRQDEPIEVVGVVETATYQDLGEDPKPHVFVPAAQLEPSSYAFVIASRLGDAAVQRLAEAAIAGIDPAVAVPPSASLASILDRELGRYRTGATMIGLFAVLALLLAALGLYAVLTYQLLRRLREVGVRIAVGASPRRVAESQLTRALRPVLAGLALGLVGALASGRLLEGLLFGVETLDPLSYGVTVALLLAAALAAAAVPTVRALRVDPVQVLRAE
ncbi:MAG: hypothetical protein DWQ30_22220 [Acidobacteria bacterium]|nr:MAG: hypothetical protein DWQ30_22220 [Acidobacteriota bacterium]